MAAATPPPPGSPKPPDIRSLSTTEAVRQLQPVRDEEVASALLRARPSVAVAVLAALDETRRLAVASLLPEEIAGQWLLAAAYPEQSVGRLMEAPSAVFSPDRTVGETIEELREIVKQVFVTYAFVVDASARLVGVVTFRDLLLSDHGQKLSQVMLEKPFFLEARMALQEAWKAVLHKHFPVYPVCDSEGHLLGLVRGSMLFEEQAIEISAQAGSMVGVDREERLSTPWPRSFRFRQPWLQLNLLTAFVAAGVVAFFQDTIDRLVILAIFLPVLSGQSGNTGCQALAVSLRGLTLGELRSGRERALVIKEAWLGLLNGALVGVSAGLGMYMIARSEGNPAALALALIVWVAMVGSCIVSGLSGALIPLALRRLGADPATASSIFLTTATDVASMAFLLGLATVFVA
ncbi:Magnesium transporter MgtE [Myxococcaceae bacterium]|nr:Magnesium transporter MgtE [Myxococcaceae bacterium]